MTAGCLCLRHHAITRTGTFCGLWTSKMQSSHIKASSSSPQAQFSPTETPWQSVCTRSQHHPPPSLSPSQPLAVTSVIIHYTPPTPIRHWWLLVHVDCLPTVHTLKEPLALCTLATWSKWLIIKPLWVPGWSETLLLYYSKRSGGNEPVSLVPSYSDECKWGKAREASWGVSWG